MSKVTWWVVLGVWAFVGGCGAGDDELAAVQDEESKSRGLLVVNSINIPLGDGLGFPICEFNGDRSRMVVTYQEESLGVRKELLIVDGFMGIADYAGGVAMGADLVGMTGVSASRVAFLVKKTWTCTASVVIYREPSDAGPGGHVSGDFLCRADDGSHEIPGAWISNRTRNGVGL